MSIPRKFLSALLGAVLLMPATLAAASGLATPTGPVVLTVSGQLGVTNGAGAAAFDKEMLRALGTRTIETSTIWTDGVHSFTGVPLDLLLAAVEGKGSTLRATAINDYAIEIPASDAVPGGPIVAYEMDGAPMSVRDKGPLWIVYPFDSSPDYQTEVIYSRSIWQLDRIDVSE